MGWNHNLVSRLYVRVFQAEDPLVPQFWTLEVMKLGTLIKLGMMKFIHLELFGVQKTQA